jgi:flagellar hook-associated protein 3 FlgL
MRVTQSMYYDNLYGTNNSNLNKRLFDVNKQIASGLKIQYASDDIATFTETMRLDNEITTLTQITKSTESAYKISNQTDVVLNEFETSMNRMRTLLLNAANGVNDDVALDAISAELRGIEEHFKNLANTSINGQFLFSGSAVDTRPISEDGTYNGNNVGMKAFLGSHSQQQYNLSGGELFLGEEVLVKREITSNVVNKNPIVEYESMQASGGSDNSATLSVNSTIRDLMGDTDDIIDSVNNKHHFYLRGTTSDGTMFNKKISMKDDDKIDELLIQIGNSYGNTPNLKLVDVSFNEAGQIVLEDKMKGSSKLDFHLVGAVDFAGGGAADVTDIDLLDAGETNFGEVINPTVPPANTLYIKEFVKSGFNGAAGAASNIEGLLLDRTQFVQSGSKLSSNVAQIEKKTNAFATPSTKISEVADLSQGTADTLDGTQFKLTGFDVGGSAFDVQIDFKNSANGGSTFSLDGGVTNYSIFNVKTPRTAVDADDMTYQQLMDVVNMVVTNNIPASTNTDTDYDTAISSSNSLGQTYLSSDGRMEFVDMQSKDTQARISLHDSNSGQFANDPATTASSVMAFNSNNALTIRDPKTDFFKAIDEMITAVENYKERADASSGDKRNVGIQNSIAMMDNLQEHVFRSHSLVGAQSNTLTNSLERTEILKLSTMTLRSSTIDTDLAEASLTLTQLSLNYEAMLSTVGRVSKLSLVNYL